MIQLALVSFLLLFGTEAVPSHLNQVLKHIEDHQDEYVQVLKEWIAVQSDSNDVLKRDDLLRMMEITASKITDVGGTAELVNVGDQKLPNGETIPLPPVVLGEVGKDPLKPTVCIYGHVDVQPAKKEDGWDTDPYVLTEINGNLYGRGASDNKAPVLAWINAVSAFQALEIDIPVNVKFFIEGMEETGSPALDELIQNRNDTFFTSIDYIVISDCSWLSKKPALTYGTRGNCYFFAEVECAKQDLHSGVFGGSVHEAMSDLIALLDSLSDSSGKILVPGISDAVAPLTDEEEKLYEGIEFNLEHFKNEVGTTGLRHNSVEGTLLHRWRYPSLSIHGIEGAFSEPGTKTVIPAKVIGKFSIRQVPNMDPQVVKKQVTEYLQTVFTARNTPNKLKVTMVIGVKPWLANVNNSHYIAGRRAVERVFGVKPDMIREGGTIPIARILQEVLQKSIMMLPIGGADDGIHSQNEKISRYNFIEGTKLFAAYFQEIAQL
ncbi:beta-Ala-His dipeptidase [Latimeria chalumnae]|uniref:Carnosine dipeptidase 1 n=1 Tax=Latimeria chalumnae TaxID=7897 RepID=H3BCM1_LATCH|nr:PREDICTED: beta-Ala-His dipeptidase-like [Latimeria chalumnae]|eukprot:XP_005990781.1 PREDICTED: beta-Ala-His dipeptidase-like [Latimeria chalumnae]